jgi:hypothetical protein
MSKSVLELISCEPHASILSLVVDFKATPLVGPLRDQSGTPNEWVTSRGGVRRWGMNCARLCASRFHFQDRRRLFGKAIVRGTASFTAIDD